MFAKLRLPAIVLALLLVLPLAMSQADADQDASTSIWDGVFNEEQVARGEEQYTQHCASCHGDDLRGRNMAANLTSMQFFLQWHGQPVYDYFDRIRKTMPQGAPNSLSTQAYVDIVAYIMHFNGVPAGESELEAVDAVLQQIVIEREASPAN